MPRLGCAAASQSMQPRVTTVGRVSGAPRPSQKSICTIAARDIRFLLFMSLPILQTISHRLPLRNSLFSGRPRRCYRSSAHRSGLECKTQPPGPTLFPSLNSLASVRPPCLAETFGASPTETVRTIQMPESFPWCGPPCWLIGPRWISPSWPSCLAV